MMKILACFFLFIGLVNAQENYFNNKAIRISLKELKFKATSDNTKKDLFIKIHTKCGDNEADLNEVPIYVEETFATSGEGLINSGHLNFCFTKMEGKDKEIIIEVIEEETNDILARVYLSPDLKVNSVTMNRPSYKKPQSLETDKMKASYDFQASVNRKTLFGLSSEIEGSVSGRIEIEKLERN